MSTGSRFDVVRRYLDAQSVLVACLLLVCVLLVQVVCGAYSAELTTNADEAAHFLSGLMVRDYLVGGLGQSPLEYARNYYAHYPKIGIGNWPPAYYGMQGVWMLVVPPSRAAVLVLLAVLVTTISWLIFRATRPTLGAPLAMFAAVTFLMLRPVPSFTSTVMAELPLAFFCVAATFAWMRFLETEQSLFLACFGVFAVCAIMIKGNGIALALLPPFSIVISNRWRVLRVPALWITAAIVATLTVPWVLYYLPTMRAGWALPNQPIGQFSNPFYYPKELVRALGVVVVTTALLGVWVRLQPRGKIDSGGGRQLWTTALAVILSGTVFHTVAPGGLLDIRHMIMILPFVAMFVAAGAGAIATGIERAVRHRAGSTAIAVVLIGTFVARQSVPLRGSPLNGFRAAAALVTGSASTAPAVALISSDASGEGAFVVEMALRDPHRPTNRVWRASKLLANTTWAGREYRMRASTTDSILVLLDRANVRTIVFDRTWADEPHQQLLLQLMRQRTDRFTLRWELPLLRESDARDDAILVYDLRRQTPTPPDSVLRQVPGYDGVLDPAKIANRTAR